MICYGDKNADNNEIFFFDFTGEDEKTLFTDYHQMKKDIKLIVGTDGRCKGEIGEEKQRKKISTIIELQNVLKDYVIKVRKILESDLLRIIGPVANLEKREEQTFCLSNMSYYFDCSNLNIDLLVEQLVFDILFDKYLKETELMSLWEYAKYMREMMEGESQDAIYQKLRDSMEYDFNMKKYSGLQEELLELGINLDKYEQRYRTEKNIKKNPKYVWDYLYYNRYLITYRQFRRQSLKDSNFSYEELVRDLQDYDKFVKKLLPIENESPHKYFVKSMEYYYLESYKRIDFMLKLAAAMPKMGITEMDKDHFLIKRFHPKVLEPYEEGGELSIKNSKHNYYRSLFRIEETIHKQMQCDNKSEKTVYADQLLKYNIVRAKTYELFMYHNEYISSDYKDIKDFIQKNYNMRFYHESNDIWETIQSCSYKKMESDKKRKLRAVLRYFVSINESLFWKSPKRKFDISINLETEEES